MIKIFKFLIIISFGYFQFIDFSAYAQEKIKVGLLVPITGDDKELGKQIIKSTRIALKDINTDKLEIFLKDTNSNPNKTFDSALELREWESK